MTSRTTTPVPVPDVQVARNEGAGPVYVTPVLEVVSSEPRAGRSHPGHYQHILLNTVTGELAFHESTEHLEEWNPAWRYRNDVPEETSRRWHPGRIFCHTGPHQWFEPVPEVISWTIDSGTYVKELPYLGVDQANELLIRIQPYAQQLITRLFVAGGELDWSRDSAIAGRQISRLCSRYQQPASDQDADADLVDYATIIERFPHLYQPTMLSLSLDKLADRCETITRFLGCNEHWDGQIKKVFGKPYADGSGIGLDKLGVRAWYRTLLLGDDPRAVVEFGAWDLDYAHTARISADMTDEALDAWVETCETEAALNGKRLIGTRDAGEAYRRQLRERDWDRLAVLGADVSALRRALEDKTTERQTLVTRVAGWISSDSTIADRARMSRQAVHAIRTGAGETA